MLHTVFQDKNNGSDQDSDSVYVTNQPEIVARANYCHNNYETIVNNIPKEKNSYDNTLRNLAIIDNKLAASQRDIGESTNVAQICLSYWYTTGDDKYEEYTAALSVICQASIDGTKRTFDINIPGEIKRIKEEANIKKNGYPAFWRDVRPDLNRNLINYNLVCPMNAVHNLTAGKANYKMDTIPIGDFFINHENEMPQKKSKKIEELIEKYNLKQQRMMAEYKNDRRKIFDDFLILRADYEDMLDEIRHMTMPDKYLGLMSWLINRCFMITPGVARNKDKLQSKLDKNRSLLIKVLYDLNPKIFLKCFKNG